MATTIVNNAGSQHGIELAETGVEIQSYEITYKPEFKTAFKNRLGETSGFAVPTLASGEISIDATYIGGSTGLMAATFLTATTIANDKATFGGITGGVYMDEVSEKQSPEGFRSLSFKFSINPSCA